MFLGKLLNTTMALALVVTAVAGRVARAEDTTPPEAAAAFVDGLANETLAVLDVGKERRAAVRRANLSRLIHAGFDLKLMGRLALGRYWHDATSAQRDEYQRLFATYVLDTYVRRIAAYGDGTFAVVDTRRVGDAEAMVEMRVNRASTSDFQTGWRVRTTDGEHRVVDVAVDGVSMVLAHRHEFASVVARHGVDGLLAALRRSVAAPPRRGMPDSRSYQALLQEFFAGLKDMPSSMGSAI